MSRANLRAVVDGGSETVTLLKSGLKAVPSTLSITYHFDTDEGRAWLADARAAIGDGVVDVEDVMLATGLSRKVLAP